MKRWRKDKISIFTDSMSGVMMIRDIKDEGDTAPLWDVMMDIMNEWKEVTIS